VQTDDGSQPELRPPGRWVAPLLLAVAAALVPWTIALGWQLPQSHTSQHWDAAWVGLDIAEGAALAATGYAVARSRVWIQIPAAITASLLLVDAWFDNLLANSPTGHLFAALEAGIGEVPLAAICIWIALNAERTEAAVMAARSRLDRRRE
jgi:hypothetical protein